MSKVNLVSGLKFLSFRLLYTIASFDLIITNFPILDEVRFDLKPYCSNILRFHLFKLLDPLLGLDVELFLIRVRLGEEKLILSLGRENQISM